MIYQSLKQLKEDYVRKFGLIGLQHLTAETFFNICVIDGNTDAAISKIIKIPEQYITKRRLAFCVTDEVKNMYQEKGFEEAHELMITLQKKKVKSNANT